jgi:hypothetical protein
MNRGRNAPVFNPRVDNADVFWYGARVTGLSSTATTGTSIINIDADSDFYCVALSYQADIAAAALTEQTNIIPLVNLLITDTGSGKSLSNVTLPMGTYMGDGKRPYRLPAPRVFLSNATIQLNYTSYVAAGTTYNITTVLHGYKVYKGQ